MSTDREIRKFYDTASFADELEQASKSGPTVAPAGEAMESFAVRLPAAVLNQVRAQAREEKVSTGAVLRRLIESALNTPAEDKVIPASELREIISRSAAETAARMMHLRVPTESQSSIRRVVDAVFREHGLVLEDPKTPRSRRVRGSKTGRVVTVEVTGSDGRRFVTTRRAPGEKGRKRRANT